MRRASYDYQISLDRNSDAPLYLQIYAQLRDAIISGKLPSNVRLASIRALAAQTGASHITVESAYRQLLAEGLVKSVPGSGFVVEELDLAYFSQNVQDDNGEIEAVMAEWHKASLFETAQFPTSSSGLPPVAYDFSYVGLPRGMFPRKLWAKLASEAVYALEDEALAQYRTSPEATLLQQAVASSLGRIRAIACAPEQVVIETEWDGALAKILELFDRSQDIVMYEDPGWDIARGVEENYGYKTALVPSACGMDAYLQAIAQAKPKVLFVTPSVSFGAESIMPFASRLKLLETAQRDDFYIVEYDMGAYYRFDSAPIPSLYSLDRTGRVIYLGDFSWTLSPALRIAYFVLPPRLLRRHAQKNPVKLDGVSLLLQDTLASFIAEGHLDTQIRRISATLRKNHDRLLRSVKKVFGSDASIAGAHSGMHIALTVRNGMEASELCLRAREHGAIVYPAGLFYYDAPAPESTVLLGFSRLALDDIEPGVEALKRAWFSKSPSV